MEIYKPQRLGLLKRSVLWGGRTLLSLGLLTAFPFAHPRRLMEEGEMWEAVGPALGDHPLDTGEPKARGEVVVFGDYFAPGGNPVLQHGARVAVGPIDKSIRITGAREWTFDREGRLIVTQPQPFTAMKLDWRLAFGGPDFVDNPAGRGHVLPNVTSPDGRYPLPCLEYPHDVVKMPGDVVMPAGFGPRDIMLPARQRFAGTYDRFWADNHAPGLAADATMDLFQVAPPDQQIDGFFGGAEPIMVEHLHPSREQLNSRLPGVRPRLFLRRRQHHEVVLEEQALRADTLVLFPALEIGVLIHRAHLWVSAFDHPEIDLLLAGFEWQEQEPRSRAYYGDDLMRRLDPEDGFRLGLDYTSLSPEGWQEPPREMAKWFKVATPRDPVLPPRLQAVLDAEKARSEAVLPASVFKEMAARAAAMPGETAELKALRAEIDAFSAAAAGATDARKLEPQIDRILGLGRGMVEQTVSDGEARARQLAARGGLDYDKLLAEAAAKAPKTPREMVAAADAEVERLAALTPQGELRDKVLAHKPGDHFGALDGAMDDIASLQALMQARAGHLMPLPEAPPPAEAARRLAETRAMLAGGGDMARGQFAGLDLSGLDFSRLDLTEADFTNCRLVGARFHGANLTRASFAAAVLDEAQFNGAQLMETNLGKASISRAVFSSAQFTKALLAETVGEAPVFVDAEFSEVTFNGVALQGASFIDARFLKSNFLECMLNEAAFDRAQFEGVSMIDCRADLACFFRARMVRLTLVNCRLHDADFSATDVERLATAGKVDLSRARFDRAKMPAACFIGAVLPNTSWVATNLAAALFNNADLRQAHFHAARLAGASFMRADLGHADLRGSDCAGASFIHTDLRRASLVDVSLYGADLTDTLMEDTVLDGAMIDLTRLAGPNFPG